MAPVAAGAPVLLLGGSGPVGGFLIERLAGQGALLMAVSRQQPIQSAEHVIWLQHDLDQGPADVEPSVLISLGPLRHALDQVRTAGRIGRVIALSSASTLFKMSSSDPAERALMAELTETEESLTEACRAREIDLTLLKPAMIYGTDQNANVERVAGLIGRLRVAPYCGQGLRQPVHADDLARLIVH
ncbi:MAG: NAD-dependent epimerase/dehydratase family protein, partial [Wenzhouxiangella sp.]